MNREFLKELGLSDEQVESIMKEHGKTVNSTKDELDKIKQEKQSVESERDTLKSQNDERDKKLEELQNNSEGNEELKATIDELKRANAKEKEELEQQLREQKFNYELDQKLLGHKVRNVKAVRALLDTDTIKMDDEGIKGLSEQIENLQETDSYLFDTENSEGGQSTPQPSNNYTPAPNSHQTHNRPKDANPYELGKQKAQERFGLNTKEE